MPIRFHIEEGDELEFEKLECLAQNTNDEDRNRELMEDLAERREY